MKRVVMVRVGGGILDGSVGLETKEGGRGGVGLLSSAVG